ncbi:MAG: porin [Chthoniobacter sp.]|jgi:porin|nr:porin [Chthoniobacter sp.]
MKPTCLISFATLTLATTGLAAPPPALEGAVHGPDRFSMNSYMAGDYFFGDWGGARARLADSGVTFDSYYVMNPAGNVSGGKKDGFSYVDNFYFGVTFDLEKLVGWRGLQFAVSGINRSGGSVTNAYVGSQYDVQQVHGGQNVFLYNVTLEQRFWNDKVKLKIGRFGASDDFNTSSLYGLYMNNGIDGNIRNALFDTQFSAYPFATWAARLRVDPTPEFNFQLGVFQTWDQIFDRTHNGLDWSIRDDDGVMILAQAGWTPELFKRPMPVESAGKSDGKKAVAAPEMKGLPGHYWVGGSYSPWKGYSQFGRIEKTSGSYGFYAHADQMVWQEAPGSEQGLTVFVASGYYPQDNISIIPWQLNVGAFYTGLIPGREEDKTIAGLIYGRFGDDYARTIEAAGSGKPTQETIVELAYRIQLSKFAYLQPDVQFVFRPGGTGRLDDAVVVGAQMGISF